MVFLFEFLILFIENADMPSGVDYEIKTEPDDSSGQETAEKQTSEKESQDSSQAGMRKFYFYHLK